MNKFERLVRTWLAVIGFMALANSVQCFVESTYIMSSLYVKPQDQVNALVGRMFGTWTILSGVVRLMCALFVHLRPLYDVTLFSFILVWAHFLSELYIFQTTELSAAVVMPLVIAGISIGLMIAGYFLITFGEHEEEERPQKRRRVVAEDKKKL